MGVANEAVGKAAARVATWAINEDRYMENVIWPLHGRYMDVTWPGVATWAPWRPRDRFVRQWHFPRQHRQSEGKRQRAQLPMRSRR